MLTNNEEYLVFKKMSALQQLKSELRKGFKSGEKDGWIDADDIRPRLEERYRG